jgi:hypothetical protein
MPRKRDAAKPASPATQPADAVPPAEPRQDASAEPAAADGAGEAPRSKWLPRFNSWDDQEAGVYLTEDRQNRRMTVRFAEKPPEAVRQLMKEEYGYRFDSEDPLWYKPINPAKARQCRAEAEELAFKSANLIRQDKGMEPKAAFLLGM